MITQLFQELEKSKHNSHSYYTSLLSCHKHYKYRSSAKSNIELKTEKLPLLIICCFRKDSRLYSYLPVVGMTLKLYNLLPHPTVQASSELGEDCCFSQDKSGQLQTAFVILTIEKVFPSLPQSSKEVILVTRFLNFKILPIIACFLSKQVVAVIVTTAIKLLLHHQSCSTDVTSHLKSQEKSIRNIVGRHTFLPLQNSKMMKSRTTAMGLVYVDQDEALIFVILIE